MKRRKFLRAGLLTTAAVGVFGKTALSNDPEQFGATEGVHVVQTGAQVGLHSPSFVFNLDISAGLAARSWQNKLSGRTLQLAGDSELDVDLDAARE